MAVFLWVLAVCIVLLWLFLRPGRYGEAQKQLVYGVNHAHRGLHTKDKTVPENSLPAFRAAAEAGYGVELDIQLSRDGQVVVFHDDTLDRVCGVHGRVDEFTFEELRGMRLCGTQETIPLLTEVFEVMGGSTGTDADCIAASGSGVRTVLFSIPQKYMHTPVETVAPEDVKATAELLCAYITDLARDLAKEGN